MKPKKKRIAAKTDVRVRLSVLLDEALDRAIAFGSRRAFKHRDTPIAGPDELVTALVDTLPGEFWRALDEMGVEVE